MRNSLRFYIQCGMTTIVLIGITLTAGCNDKKNTPRITEELATIEGTWAGVVNHTYYCETSPSTIELDITASTITISGGTTFTIDTVGSITQQTGQAYSVTLNDVGGDVQGQLFVDPAINYALLTIYDRFGGDEGYVGLLQKDLLTSTTYQETDLVGSWLGTAVRVNANFEVTETTVSSATITNPAAGLQLSGTDGDGSFSAAVPGILLESGNETFGIYRSRSVDWPADSYEAIYALSLDKNVVAVGFLTNSCSKSIFADLPSQKFAIWIKQ